MSQYNASQLSLYYYSSCPFCVRVVNVIKDLGAEIELKNVIELPQHAADLKAATGKKMVPCLRITKDNKDTWMHESGDIVIFLKKHFS